MHRGESQTTVVTEGEEGGERPVLVRRTPETYKERVESNMDDPSSLLFPAVLTLLENEGTTTSKERLAVCKIILLEVRPPVLVLVKEPRHLRFLLGS